MNNNTTRPDAVYLSNLSEIKEHLENLVKINAEVFVNVAESSSAKRNSIDTVIKSIEQLKQISEFESSLIK